MRYGALAARGGFVALSRLITTDSGNARQSHHAAATPRYRHVAMLERRERRPEVNDIVPHALQAAAVEVLDMAEEIEMSPESWRQQRVQNTHRCREKCSYNITRAPRPLTLPESISHYALTILPTVA